ncbi:PLDc N-terminal domain-containing protein [Pseudomonas sp. Q2-TVG4-2]|uniref:PLDc N-terminal domain-containing protein n=1 Tax=Pseudomonas sp. Q2-TVG4-2 TaxID=1685699 RepID=UPI0015E78FC2|nr:PLDc N-terminal domain-containing protein [Pseudomonas sp. Q2-TVG4-2]
METWSALLALIVLVADVVAIVQVWRTRIEVGRKVIWSLVIVLLPVVGLIMWFIAAGHFAKVRL